MRPRCPSGCLCSRCYQLQRVAERANGVRRDETIVVEDVRHNPDLEPRRPGRPKGPPKERVKPPLKPRSEWLQRGVKPRVITPEEKAQIVALFLAKTPVREVWRLTGISRHLLGPMRKEIMRDHAQRTAA